MATKKFSQKSRDSIFGELIQHHITDSSNLLDALDFVESPQGLDITLYPVQRVLLKLIFGIPMDRYEQEVPVYDIFCENLLYTFKETEYIKYVHDQGRINISNWQDASQGGYNEIVAIVGRRGGKALAMDTPIPTTTGWKTNGELTLDDKVFDPDGNPIAITQIHPSFVSETYRVTFDDKTYVVVHPGHLWHTHTKSDRRAIARGRTATGSVKTTEEIKNSLLHNGEVNHSIPLSKSIQLPASELPMDPYFLGLWLGDGRSDSISLDNKTQTILESMRIWKNKAVPNEFLWASETQRLDLLQGLMDSGGSCNRGRCEFSNKSELLTQAVYHLAASLGLKPSAIKEPSFSNGEKKSTRFRVTWTGEVPVFHLPRKLAKLPSSFKPTQKQRYIVSVQPDAIQEVRCITVEPSNGLFLFGKNFNVTHNSQLVSAIAAYKLYRLLNIHSPQDYYGLVQGSPIDFTFMAQDSEGSSRLFDKMKEDINRAPFFSPFLKSMNTEEMTFVSEADRHKRDITPSIKVASYPCTTGSVRGPSSFVLALDEFAFYRTQIGANSDEIYKAAAPATMQFKAGGTREGKRESMILIITSPNGKIGKYYSLYQSGMKMGNKSDILAFRCSTAEMNPRSDVDFLKKEYRENPDVFRAEYGGDFLEAAESYVRLNTIDECIDQDRTNVETFDSRMIGQKFFWGLDLGMQHDGTALSICHWEPLPSNLGAKLVYDYIDRLMVGEGKYEGFKQLPLEDVLEWLQKMNDLLPCHKGATDQHGGSMLVQLLQTYGINGLDLVHLTSGINSQMYLVLKGLMEQKKVSFPNVKKFHDELKLVEANYMGKYQIRVQAPAEKDAHDDMCDSTALASWVAQQWTIGEGAREFADIMNGWNPANFVNGLPKGGLDLQTASMAELKSWERQASIMQKIHGGVQNPYRRR